MISTVNSLELLETPKNIASGRSQSIQSKSNCSAVLPSYIETTAESANHMWGSCENEPPNHNAHHTDVSDWGFLFQRMIHRSWSHLITVAEVTMVPFILWKEPRVQLLLQ